MTHTLQMLYMEYNYPFFSQCSKSHKTWEKVAFSASAFISRTLVLNLKKNQMDANIF
jgi:hypothetical protein